MLSKEKTCGIARIIVIVNNKCCTIGRPWFVCALVGYNQVMIVVLLLQVGELLLLLLLEGAWPVDFLARLRTRESHEASIGPIITVHFLTIRVGCNHLKSFMRRRRDMMIIGAG